MFSLYYMASQFQRHFVISKNSKLTYTYHPEILIPQSLPTLLITQFRMARSSTGNYRITSREAIHPATAESQI